ncbi:hypothetical protein QQ020_12255 [Fulvivirgaceae bacterium BMA12]|uniref:DUF2158 domain-containing protein n=1 Tax=Agaribacillus aureus TaxID=3051825 RepID=A0ABT8L538_9BACT|nr:hypothetical protein [Fulvivirgaceae bacterium BMA12]
MKRIKVGDAVHAIMNKKVMIVSGIMGQKTVECAWLDENEKLCRRTFKSQSLYLIDDYRLKEKVQQLKSILIKQKLLKIY